MTVGVALPFWLDRPPLEAVDVALNAERLRYPELWIGEMTSFDAFALAGAVASRTAHITLTVGPLPLPLRDPAALAMGVASVSALGGRPAHLALGASSPTVLRDWHGATAQPSRERFGEVTALCRQLLAGERSRFAGSTVASRGFRLKLDSSATTITIAAFGPRLLELAGRIADRVVIAHVSPAQTSAVRQRLDDASGAAGRRPELVVYVAAALEDAGRAQIGRALVAYVGQPGYGEMFTDLGFGELVAWARSGPRPSEIQARLPDGLIRAVGALGSVQEVRARLDEYQRSGADLVCVVPATAGDAGAAVLLEELGPAARSAGRVAG